MSFKITQSLTRKESIDMLGIDPGMEIINSPVEYSAKRSIMVCGDIATIEFEIRVNEFVGVRHFDCPYVSGEKTLDEAEAFIEKSILELG